MRILLFLALLTTAHAFAQSTRWSVKLDSADVFSSPRFVDLNKDGVKDVVIGGGIESIPSSNGVIALDGVNGEKLWSVAAYSQMYTSALFQDIDGDGVPDVFIGGRAASFFAISGATGEIIWKFWNGTASESRKEGLLNFFCTQWLEDHDGDGFKDLLVTNGGDYLASSKDKSRPTATLMILSAKDGSVITHAKMPEKRESYYAPHLIGRKQKTIVFGTGGETVDGKIWKTPLKRLLKGELKRSKVLIADTAKGFILNSVLADLTGNGKQDLLTTRMNGTITAIDPRKRKQLWELSFPGYECYVTSSLGQFVGDDTPDLFTIVAKGTFPQYSAFKLVIIDGKTGKLAWSEDSGFNQFSPAICVDLDGNGQDEIIYVENTLVNPETYELNNRLRVINLKDNSSYYLGSTRSGISMASSPGIVDLEENGTSEIVVATSSLNLGKGAQYSTVECINLDVKPDTLTWPGYLGPFENGSLK